MKKLLSILFATMLSLNAMADDYNLYVVTASTTTSYSVSNIQKITFSGSNVVITSTNGTANTFAMADINRLYLNTATADAISTPTVDAIENGSEAQIYLPSGALVGTTTVTDGSLKLDNMPKGIYIVKIGSQTYKFAKQ